MKKIISLALPLIVSQLIAVALVLTDVWMMSRISVEALAAGGLGASVYTFIFVVSSSIVGCVANLVAIAYGQRAARPEFANKQIRLAVKGAVLLSVVLTLVISFLFAFIPHLLILADQPAEVIKGAMSYADAMKWALLPSFLLLVLRGLTSAFGRVRSIMVMSLLTVIINVPISYCFAFVLNMGLAGLGYGSSLAALIVMLGYGIWVFDRQEFKKFAPWLNVQEYSIKLMKPLLSLGIPIALAASLENGLIYGGTLLAGTIGVMALAIHQILLQCLSFAWNINFGFSQASAILVGQDFGADNPEGIKQTSIKSFVLVTALSGVLSAIFIIWPDFILGMFGVEASNTELTRMFASVIWVVALCFVVDGWQLLAINLLRGMKIVNRPTISTAVGYWLFGLPSAWYLMSHIGLAGIWAGIGVGLAVTGVLLLIQLNSAIHKQSHSHRLAQA
ncbi:MATE family efflux transporter [Vibrio marisflavi]|uniref:Multidrug resistance protein MdtK n=1 Tax=Vibrio marisflavi CECT 7928 TaxID=634439 RepID=A0ABM8ZZB0_9VIBR|nr:MATE family efflux transporter [Vibrio marisflavi]CAH0536265.1 Multidrug resistance protein MdtK [Vibrio marisflavi CECT 7928]